MNRHALAEATSLHDGPVPVYLMEEIANSTKSSDRDAEKTADYMLGRLNKSNLNVKLKALQIISYCIREGSPAFTEAIRDEEQEISAYLQFSGPPDPVYGDEKYRRIRVASQEALVCLNDGFLSRRNEGPPQEQSPQQQQSPQGPQGATNSWQAPQGDNAPSYGNPNAGYNQGGQPERQHSNVGGSWGQPQAPTVLLRIRITRQEATMARLAVVTMARRAMLRLEATMGNQEVTMVRLEGTMATLVAVATAVIPAMDKLAVTRGATATTRTFHRVDMARMRHSSSSRQVALIRGHLRRPRRARVQVSGVVQVIRRRTLQWKTSRATPSTRRDNRPTVLVGHSLNFPKPAGGFGSSNTGATSGLGGFNSGTYNPNAVRGASAGNSYNPNAMGGSARGSFGGHQSGGAPSYMDNSNRMLSGSTHRIGSMGLPVNGQPLSDAPTTALGKKAEVLKKMGTAALEKWDRRNMDKSMASSLADNDELRAGPQVIDHGYYQPSAQQGTGGGDTSRDYERTMIDSLCAPAGLSRAPPADGLKRFVDLAQTLDAQSIGDILLDKLEDDTWQVRLKGLHVVLALLDSPGAAPYQEFFEENVEVVEELRKDAKPSVVSKAVQLLRALGYAEEVDQASHPSTKRSGSVRAQRGSPTKKTQQEVDLLGFGSLSLESSTGPVGQGIQGTADLLGSPVRSQPPPAPAPPQEISLLDGFDTLGSSTSSNPSYAQQPPHQQQYYQQPPQDEHNKVLGHFGKDLFAIANSPRNANMAAGAVAPSATDGARVSGGQSAFNFM
ncbi:Armadillo-type fold [Phytophthora cactorum]|nr:Armadillo-type fold [Phytophthora cactorum]